MQPRHSGGNSGTTRSCSGRDGVRGTIEGYAGRTDEAAASLKSVWENVDVNSTGLVTLCGAAMMNHAFLLLSLGDFAGADEIVAAADLRFVGDRHRWIMQVTQAAAMIYRGHYRDALAVVESIPPTSEELSAFVAVMKASALSELSPRLLQSDLVDEVDTLEAESMMLGWLGRITQAEVRAARGEPRPHRDLGPSLRRLAPSRPALGWDGLALSLARFAPDEAAETLADMWDFWPTGPRAATQRAFTETLLGMHDPYPSYLSIAERYVANGEFVPASAAMHLASRLAPSGRESLAAHRKACEYLMRTDAERSLASLLRERRLRRETGSPTIPPSQRHTVHGGLTPRETEVATLAAQGMTSQEIAVELGISVATTRNHLQRLRDKLGLRSKRDLTRWAPPTG